MEQQIILDILNNMGFVVLENGNDDFNLQDYIVDSLSFVEFIIDIEDAIGFTLPESFFDYNLLLSFNGFCEKLKTCIAELSQREDQKVMD